MTRYKNPMLQKHYDLMLSFARNEGPELFNPNGGGRIRTRLPTARRRPSVRVLGRIQRPMECEVCARHVRLCFILRRPPVC